MAGMAAAEAAPWQVVLSWDEMWMGEAQKSGSDRQPAVHLLGALRCAARQCAKFRLVIYQIKGLDNRTYVPRMISRKENEAARRSQAVKCSVRRTRDCDEVRTGASRDEVAVSHPPRHWTARRMCATKEGAFKLICHQSSFCTLTRYA